MICHCCSFRVFISTMQKSRSSALLAGIQGYSSLSGQLQIFSVFLTTHVHINATFVLHLQGMMKGEMQFYDLTLCPCLMSLRQFASVAWIDFWIIADLSPLWIRSVLCTLHHLMSLSCKTLNVDIVIVGFPFIDRELQYTRHGLQCRDLYRYKVPKTKSKSCWYLHLRYVFVLLLRLNSLFATTDWIKIHWHYTPLNLNSISWQGVQLDFFI